MKNPNELKKYVLFQINECDAIKEYLEEMALKGWKLKRIQTFFYFEKIEPQALYYSVEVFSKASVFDTVPARDTNEYIEYCREAGWKFVCTLGQINIFVSNSKDTVPIETDDAQKFKAIKKGIVKQNAVSWFCLVPIFLFNAISDLLFYDAFFTSNMNLMAFLFYLIFFAATLIQVASFIAWTVRQRRRLKQGEPIQYISKSGRRKRTLLQLIPLGIMSLILLLVAIYSIIQRDFFTALMIGFIPLLIALILIFSHFLQKRGLSRTANKVIPVLLGFGICAVITGFTVIVLFAPVTEPLADSASISSKSFLASKAEYECALDNGSIAYVTVFKSDYRFIVHRYLNSSMRTMSRIFEEDYVEAHQLESEWDAKAVYTSQDGMLCIEYDKYVIVVSTESELSMTDIDNIKAFINLN